MKISKYLNQSPLFAINSAYEALIFKVNRKLRAEKVNLLQGLVLTALFFEESQKVSPSQLAALLRTTRANISHILSYLESRGWIQRALDPKDSRRFHIELRPEGRKKALSLIRFFNQIQDQFEARIGMSAVQKMVESIYQCQYLMDEESKQI